MNFLEIVGALALFVLLITIGKNIYRRFVPIKYKWENCPNDHDTMSRYGAKKCDVCGNKLND